MIRERLPEGREWPRFLTDVVREHTAGLARLERLHRYAKGRHDIALRQRAEGLPNTRLSFAFGRYISQVCAGYLLAEPVKYLGGGSEAGLQAFRRLMQSAGADTADSELAMQQSVYGRGISLNYIGGEGTMKVAALDPRSAFVVYDDTVERVPLLGVALTAGKGGGTLTAYTRHHCHQWRMEGGSIMQEPPRTRPHPFGRVPMVAYLNDREAQGDFEDLLPLMDAYDLLASDRVNDRAQFADALLVLSGVMGITAADDDPDAYALACNRLRMYRTLTLPDHDAKAQWLAKNPVEQDIDVLRRALAKDIHKFSMTPDFSDEQFAGTLSGVAIRYKLFCLEQKTRLKAGWFEAGLRERARVTAGWTAAQGMPPIEAERLRIVLTRRTPEDLVPVSDEAAPDAKEAGGEP